MPRFTSHVRRQSYEFTDTDITKERFAMTETLRIEMTPAAAAAAHCFARQTSDGTRILMKDDNQREGCRERRFGVLTTQDRDLIVADKQCSLGCLPGYPNMLSKRAIRGARPSLCNFVAPKLRASRRARREACICVFDVKPLHTMTRSGRLLPVRAKNGIMSTTYAIGVDADRSPSRL